MKKLTLSIIYIFAFHYGYSQYQSVSPSVQDSIEFHKSFIENENHLTLRSAVSSTENYNSFFVGGNRSTYYPVVFEDHGWDKHQATIVELGRSDTHKDGNWSGTIIALFKFHTTRWGHGSSFIDADIKQTGINSTSSNLFVAGWQDGTSANGSKNFIIWLRGNTTYMYNSNYPQTPQIYTSTVTLYENTYAPKSSIEGYVNTQGQTLSNRIRVNSTTPSYFKNLDVDGLIRAKEVRIETDWADFVFDKKYQLPTLEDVEKHIKAYNRLPEIPSESEVKKEGVNIAEIQVKLLQKIEELTLYIIQQDKEIKALKSALNLEDKKGR